MNTILKVSIRNLDGSHLTDALKLVEEIKAGHPNLFQQIEVTIEC